MLVGRRFGRFMLENVFLPDKKEAVAKVVAIAFLMQW